MVCGSCVNFSSVENFDMFIDRSFTQLSIRMAECEVGLLAPIDNNVNWYFEPLLKSLLLAC